MRRRFCEWRHHNIRWGRKWVEYDPALSPGDPEAIVMMQLCLCRRVYHLLEIRWGDGTVTR